MNDKQVILATTTFLEENLKNKLSLEGIAAEIGYSKFYLHRTFKSIVSVSLYDYIKKRRMSEAAKQLLDTPIPITDIAFDFGYQSNQAFSSCFTKLFKKAPARFRKQQKEFILLYPFLAGSFLDLSSQSYQLKKGQIADVELILQLMKQVINGFPYWHKTSFTKKLIGYIQNESCYIIKLNQQVIAVALLNKELAMIDCFAVHPHFENTDVETLLFQEIRDYFSVNDDLYSITFRHGDPLDSGYRNQLLRLGFTPEEKRCDLNYPTQLMKFMA